MRLSHQSNLLHYFNVYAVRDRIDFHDLEGTAQLIDRGAVDFSKFFPTAEDGSVLLANFQVLMMMINRTNVITDVSNDMNACEDFLPLTPAHIFTAAMQLLGVKGVPELYPLLDVARVTTSNHNTR